VPFEPFGQPPCFGRGKSFIKRGRFVRIEIMGWTPPALLPPWVATKRREPCPAWPSKHTQDHVKKLFWCFFGGGFFSDKLTAKSFEQMTGLAGRIHETRLLGLYVDHSENSLSVPGETISSDESAQLIELATARLGMAESQKYPDHIPPEWIEQQTWFLKVTDDPEVR
jgi:hypothetical protein